MHKMNACGAANSTATWLVKRLVQRCTAFCIMQIVQGLFTLVMLLLSFRLYILFLDLATFSCFRIQTELAMHYTKKFKQVGVMT